MEQKLNFLLDRTKPFNKERAQLLDQLTLAMNSNSPQVKYKSIQHRQLRRIKFGSA